MGKFTGDGGAGADGGLEADRAAEGVDGVLDDRQAKTGAAAGAAAAGGIDLIKPLENPLAMFGGDADAGVGDGQGNLAARILPGIGESRRSRVRRWE